MRLTASQLDQLRQIVTDHHAAFVASWINPRLLPPAVRHRLRRLGLLKEKGRVLKDAYLLGIIAARVKESAIPANFGDLRQMIRERPIPLTEPERHALHVAQMSAGQYVTALGQRVGVRAGQLVLDMSRSAAAEDRAAIASSVEEAIAHRQSVKELVSNLGHATGQWTRDLERVANTELAHALNQGTAMGMRFGEGGGDRCAVLAAPTCCQICKRLFNMPDGRPRVFLLKDLQANGSNVGRKARDMLPAFPPIHPNCGCTLIAVPDGMHMDENGDLVESGSGKPDKEDKNAQRTVERVQEGGERRAKQDLSTSRVLFGTS